MKYRKITQSELDEIVRRHQIYLNRTEENYIKLRANLSNVYLKNLNLNFVNLSDAVIENSIFINISLKYTNLDHTSMYNTKFINCNFKNTSLKYSYYSQSTIVDTTFELVDLAGAMMLNSKIIKSKFYKTFMNRMGLTGSWLIKSMFDNCSMQYIDLSYTALKNTIFLENALDYANTYKLDIDEKSMFDYPIICPDTGSFIAWAKGNKNTIIKLLIPEDAKRVNACSRVCRVDKAKVLAIETLTGRTSKLESVASYDKKNLEYNIGKTVYSIFCDRQPFNENRWNTSDNGILCYITRDDIIKGD